MHKQADYHLILLEIPIKINLNLLFNKISKDFYGKKGLRYPLITGYLEVQRLTKIFLLY